MFKNFGVVILRNQDLIQKDQLMDVIMTNVTGAKELSLKRKACYAMGSFAFILNNQQLGSLIKLLLDKVKSSSKED